MMKWVDYSRGLPAGYSAYRCEMGPFVCEVSSTDGSCTGSVRFQEKAVLGCSADLESTKEAKLWCIEFLKSLCEETLEILGE